MEVYVITTETSHPYDHRTYFNVDSLHKTEESRNKRLEEIKSDNQKYRFQVNAEWEKFTIND